MTVTAPVITGLGVVSAVGVGVQRFWDGLQRGEPRFREVSLFPTDDLVNHVAAEIGTWTPGVEQVGTLRHGRTSAFALAALQEAVSDAQLSEGCADRVVVGTTVGDVADGEQTLRAASADGQHYDDLTVDERLRPRLSSQLGHVPTELIVTACAAGNMAIIRAAQLVVSGAADVVVCGGAESLSRMAFSGFSRMRGMALARCRPFSDERDGMLLGEGAAFLVVESAEHAERRRAAIYAEVSGYGMTCDAKHPAAPDPSGSGVARAMTAALGDRHPGDVDYVCAHGTATPQNDAAEAAAYHLVFGTIRPSVSSIKALIGHSLGATSAIEAVASVLAIKHQQTIPQWELDGAEPSLGIRPATGTESDADEIDLVLNNAFAFGGNNTSVALRWPRTHETETVS